MKCVALKIQNGIAYSGADIINTHFKKEKEVGQTYYSTNVPFDSRREMEKVLFFFIHQGIPRYVLADIIKSEFNKTPFTPDDSHLYPKVYCFLYRKTFLLIYKEL